MRHKSRVIAFVVLVAIVAASAGFYFQVIPNLSSARTEVPWLEEAVATWLLHQSVPEQDKKRDNPLGSDVADITAGRDFFRQKCEICHAYDGNGKTLIGGAQYPRAPPLAAIVASISDGEIFYHIRNGIRNTGMPAWQMPDRDIWQLVAYIRHLPKVVPLSPAPAAAKAWQPVAYIKQHLRKSALLAPQQAATQSGPVSSAHYVGSPACKTCHEELYSRWQKSRMANVVRDPREHPDAIIPDLSKPDPLVKFSPDDIALVYGSRWKQRYFQKIGDDYFVHPAQWDVTHKVWRPYFVRNGTDWWAPLYPPDNFKRPTGPLCDGCHSVNYDISTKAVTEWNVGCERCHGPGSEHVSHPVADTILNPARFDYVHANDVCIQCHSQGRPLSNPIEGKYYDWPVGFHVGLNLADFWQLEEHKLGESSFSHFPDGTAHKNRMQGNDFVTSLMYARGVTCFSCHDPHGTDNPGIVRESGNGLCLGCHGPNTQNGPHAATIEQHTHHAAGSTGSACVACHMPAIAETIADVKVRSHTFRFVWPSETDTLKIPNACNLCHNDKTTAWATAALRTWADRSPWRGQ
jgi:predicted CXXCH cytochrome family protein